MEHWQLFADPRFELRFRYPLTTPGGHSVEKIEGQRDDTVRVHLVSQGSQELYFEVMKFLDLSPEEEYQRHKADLVQRFEALTITALDETRLGGLPAYRYALTWPDRERAVILVHKGRATYRIIYDPRSALNAQVLSTVAWEES